MSDIENSDLYDGASVDAPLIDSLGSAVKRLIDKGRARGFITVEELNKVLPSERETSEHIEDIMTSISDMGISIISEADADGFDGESESDADYIDEDCTEISDAHWTDFDEQITLLLEQTDWFENHSVSYGSGYNG